MHNIRLILTCLCLPLLFSCDSQNSEVATEAETGTDAALTEYESLVSEVESEELSEVEMQALRQSVIDTSRWTTEKLNLQEMYNERRERVSVSLEEMTEDQRLEAEALNKRFDEALERRGENYEETREIFLLHRGLLGLETFNLDMSDVTAANIVEVYDHFVTTVADNLGEYEPRDWDQIEGLWNTLENRYRAVGAELDEAAVAAISKAQARYLELRDEVRIQE